MWEIFMVFIFLVLQSLTYGQLKGPTQQNNSSNLFFVGDHQPRPDLGINMGPIDSGMSQWVFNNIFKHAREWRPVGSVTNWANYTLEGAISTEWSNDGYPLNFTASSFSKKFGYQTELGTDGVYPTGDYVLTFEGTGNVTLLGDAQNITIIGLNKFEFKVNQATTNGIILIITQPNVTNIDLREKANISSNDTFINKFLDLIRPFKALRFTSWMVGRVGQSVIDANTNWTTRRVPSFYTQVGQNMISIEYIVELTNLLGKDIWLSVPSSANLDFITNLAQFIKNNLSNKTQVIYIEQSANKGFNANNRTLQMQLIQAWKNVFVNDTRVKYVFSTWIQAYFDNELKFYTDSELEQFDAFSIAGITGFNIELRSNNYDINKAAGFNVSHIHEIIRQEIYRDEIDLIYMINRLALRLNIPLIGYDFGFEIVAPGWANRWKNTALASAEQQLEDLIVDALRHSMTEDLYLDWMERWWRLGGGIMFLSNIVEKVNGCPTGGNRCGYKGMLENLSQDPKKVPKYIAALKWLNGSRSSLPFTSDDVPKKVLKNCTSCVWGTCYDGSCYCYEGFQGTDCNKTTLKYLNCASNRTEFGINLDSVTDWSREVSFVDLQRRTRKWILEKIAYATRWAEYDQENITLRISDGYPELIEISKSVGGMLTRDLNGHFINGKYICLYDGDGVLDFTMDAKNIIRRDAGRVEINVTHSTDFNNGIYYRIIRTNPSNPIRNIRIFEERFEHTYAHFPYHPLFLKLMKRYQTIRFMTWSRVNVEEGDTDWSNRTDSSYYTYTLKTGVSLEHQVALCNFIGSNPWFNLPYRATNNYIQKWAQYVRDNLRPDVKIYIEIGNECWGAGDAHLCGNYAQKMGTLANMNLIRNNNLYSKDLVARICYHAKTGSEYFKIIKQVFGSNQRNRLKLVLGTQAAWSGPLEIFFLCNGSYHLDFDVISIAPYMDSDLTINGSLVDLETFYNSIVYNGINQSISQVMKIQSIINSFAPNMDLTIYEGGPGYASLFDQSNLALTNFTFYIHRDKRMYNAFTYYLKNLTQTQGINVKVYNHYTSTSAFTKYGCWGLKESSINHLDESPKFRAYMDFVDSQKSCTWNDPIETCQNNCSSNGFCLTTNNLSLKNDTCQCYFGYDGSDCSKLKYTVKEICTYECGGRGNCSFSYYDGYYAIHTCHCNQGYSGYGCGLFTCKNECNYNGKCMDYDTCQCYRGYKGTFCEIDCGCSGHGDCSNSTNNCVCDIGYKFISDSCQLDCSVMPNRDECNRPCPDCQYGYCTRGSCVCWAGYSIDTKGTCTIPIVSPNDGSQIGINPSGIADWGTQWAFVDLIKQARLWINQDIDNLNNLYIWARNEPYNLTTDGYPAKIPFERQLVTLMLRDVEQRWPNGIYHFFYDGEGEIDFGFDAKIIDDKIKGRMTIKVALSKVLDNGVFMKFKKTNPKNPLRNLRLIMDGFENTYTENPFHPLFLDRLSKFKTIRFMPWTKEHGVVNWSDRIRPESFSAGQGVAFEHMIQLSNFLKANAWLTVPYAANDDFVERMAILFRDSLRKDIKIYVEYTNEAWNSFFESGKYCLKMGLNSGLQNTDNMETMNLFYARRSREVIQIWKKVFGSEETRLIHVIGSFSLMPIVSTRVLSFENNHKAHSNVMLAITGYIDCGDPTANYVSVTDFNTLFKGCTDDLPFFKNKTKKQADIAAMYGVSLGMYESGSGLMELNTILGGGKETPGATDKYIAWNRDQRMYQVFKDYFKMFSEFNMTENCHYGYVSKPSKYGSFNLLEFQNQSESDAPRYRAILEIINETRSQVNPSIAPTCSGKLFNSSDVCSYGKGICTVQGVCIYSSTPKERSSIVTLPKSGMSLIDSFYIKTESWISDVRLEYAFGIKQENYGLVRLTDYNDKPVAITPLPYTGQPLTLCVFVRNIFGEVYTSLSNETINVSKFNGSLNDFNNLMNALSLTQKLIAILDISQPNVSPSDVLKTINLTTNSTDDTLNTLDLITSSVNNLAIHNEIAAKIDSFLSSLVNDPYKLTDDNVKKLLNIISNIYTFGFSNLTENVTNTLINTLILDNKPSILSNISIIDYTSNKIQLSVAYFNSSFLTNLTFNDLTADLQEIYSKLNKTGDYAVSQVKFLTLNSNFNQIEIKFYSNGSTLLVSELFNPIIIKFTIDDNILSTISSSSLSLSCTYYNETLLQWNTNGCQVSSVDFSQKLVKCACNHTTKFTVSTSNVSNDLVSSQLTAGAIAGIVIGSVCALGLITGAVMGLIKYKTMKKKQTNNSSIQNDESQKKINDKKQIKIDQKKFLIKREKEKMSPREIKMSRENTKVSLSHVKVN